VDLPLAETHSICMSVKKKLKKEFSIQHITFQAVYNPDCKEE